MELATPVTIFISYCLFLNENRTKYYLQTVRAGKSQVFQVPLVYWEESDKSGMSWAPQKYELPQYYDFRSMSTVRNTTCIEGLSENITLIYNERFILSGVSMLDNTFISARIKLFGVIPLMSRGKQLYTEIHCNASYTLPACIKP